MLPARFNLHRAESVEEAIGLLVEHREEATPYAGGTELLIAMKSRVLHFAHVIDIKRVRGLRGIRTRDDGGLSIGSLTTHHQLATDPLMNDRLPAYCRLSANIANARVRAAGTLGGNLCFAEPHADPPAFLCAVGAEVVLAGPQGNRTMAVQDFLVGEFSTAKAQDELMLSIEVPGHALRARMAYRSFGHLERPSVGVAAVAIPYAEGYRWRFWAGAISERPVALASLEQAMDGLPTKDALDAVVRHAPKAAESIDAEDDSNGSVDYKRHLVSVLAARVARDALGSSGALHG